MSGKKRDSTEISLAHKEILGWWILLTKLTPEQIGHALMALGYHIPQPEAAVCFVVGQLLEAIEKALPDWDCCLMDLSCVPTRKPNGEKFSRKDVERLSDPLWDTLNNLEAILVGREAKSGVLDAKYHIAVGFEELTKANDEGRYERAIEKFSEAQCEALQIDERLVPRRIKDLAIRTTGLAILIGELADFNKI